MRADVVRPRPPGPLDRVDRVITDVLSRWSIPALRAALGIVFVWFGTLKILHVSPVSELVARTVYWFDPDVVVPTLGVIEVVIGSGLIGGVFLRVVLLLFAGQMAGTFLTFIVLPHVCFRDGNPLLLTVEGEFVAKNLVLLAAGLVVGSTVRGRRALVQVREQAQES